MTVTDVLALPKIISTETATLSKKERECVRWKYENFKCTIKSDYIRLGDYINRKGVSCEVYT
jgi:hypothetical protein